MRLDVIKTHQGCWLRQDSEIMQFRKCAIFIVFFVVTPAYSFPQPPAQNELAAASAAEKARHFSEAAKQYEKFLSAPPSSASADEIAKVRVRLAIDQFIAHRYQDSLQALAPLMQQSKSHMNHSVPAQAWIIAGLDELELNRLENAIRNLRKGLLADPESGTARLALGDALARSGHLYQAIRQYREQATRTPKVVEAWYKIGVAERVLAGITRKQFEQTDSGSAVSRLLEAQERLDRGDGLGAGNILLPLAEKGPGIPASQHANFLPGLHSLLGEALLDQSYLRAARQEFQREIAGDSESAPAWFGLAEIATLDSRWDAVRSRLLHVMIYNPKYLENRLQKQPPAPLRSAWTSGSLHMPQTMAGTTEGRLWQSWIKANGIRDVHIESQRRNSCSELPARQDYKPGIWLSEGCAMRLAQELELKHSLSPEQTVKLAEVEYRLGRFEKAESSARRVVESRAANSLVSAWASYWLVQSAEALSLAALEKAAAIDPNAPRVRQLLAENYADHYQWSKAIEEYQAALLLAPNLAGLHFGLGTAYWQAGNWKQAQTELVQSLRITPESTVAAYELGDTYINMHQWGQAVLYLRKALANPQVARQARLDLAKAQSELGHYQEALANLTPLVDNDPDGQIHFRLGTVYRKLGKMEEARRALAESQKLHLAHDAMTTARMKELEQDRARLRQAEKDINK
jgi:tetratricopeptide (TPR) repeat protein